MAEPQFRKSTNSANNGCVEFAATGDLVLMRDSKNPAGPVLTFTRREINAFLLGAKAGEFEDLT